MIVLLDVVRHFDRRQRIQPRRRNPLCSALGIADASKSRRDGANRIYFLVVAGSFVASPTRRPRFNSDIGYL